MLIMLYNYQKEDIVINIVCKKSGFYILCLYIENQVYEPNWDSIINKFSLTDEN